jgi:biopolymer transport protein ExbD
MRDFQAEHKIQPNINVTPLIDVLLVLLIIFMVITPLKPSRFEARLPAEPERDDPGLQPNIDMLVVTIEHDGSLRLNQVGDSMGSVNDTGKLSAKLATVFDERLKNHVYASEMQARTDLPEAERIQKTVFIKAPRAIRYGEVAKVIDGIKGAGANPIGLQIDDLN